MGEEETKRIIGLLTKLNIPFKHLVHEPVYTSEQASKIRKSPLHNGIKSMVLETERGVIIALISADLKLDLKKLKKKFNFKKLQMAPPELVKEKTSCEPGSVPPFGYIQPLPTYIDKSVFDHEQADFNVGLTTESIQIQTSELRKILSQKLLDFAKKNEQNEQVQRFL
jgi:Ala-tRNA(Pro) deacylase